MSFLLVNIFRLKIDGAKVYKIMNYELISNYELRIKN